MIISLLTEKLKEIVDIVTSICPNRNDINVLNYFYLEAKNGEVNISATDLEINYQTKFPARIQKEGNVLIPAKQFERIIDNFYEDEVSLEVKDNVLLIRGTKSFSSLPGLLKDDYPSFSEIDYSNYFEIDNNLFENYIQKLYPILLTSDIRPEYSGIYFDLKNDNLNLVATDTIRLGVQKIKNILYETNIKNVSVILPKRLIEEYKKIKKKSGKLKFYFEENQVTLEINNNKFTSKISVLSYPNYQEFVSPTSFIFTFLINRDNVLKALKLAKVFMDQFKEVKLDFDLNKNIFYLYARNELLGENKNEIEIEIKDNNLNEPKFEVKFHADFLYDGFNCFDSEQVFVAFFSAFSENTPIYLKSPLDDDFVYISIHR